MAGRWDSRASRRPDRIVTGLAARVGMVRVVAGLLSARRAKRFRNAAGVAAMFAVFAFATCCIPARRAMHADTIIALRQESHFSPLAR